MPCVARHKVTREKRVWRDRMDCDRWFRFGDPTLDQADWDIVDDEPVPFWGSGMMHPGPDGRDPNGPVYDTPDCEPAGGAPTEVPPATR